MFDHPTRTTIYVRAPAGVANDAARGAARAQGYVPLRAPIPKRYPREGLEVREWLASDEDGSGWTTIIPEALDRVFYWTRELSEQAPGHPIIGLTEDPFGDWRAKAYSTGRPIAKLGADPDDEVLYPIAPADAQDLEQLSRALSLGRDHAHAFRELTHRILRREPTSAAAFTASLGAPPPASFRELGADAPGYTYVCWVKRGSPLLDL